MMKKEPSIKGLVANLQSDTDVERSFQLLFERYYQPVVGYLMRQGLAFEDSRELAQETFLRAYQKISGFKGDASFATWLFKIAANLARNQARKRNADKRRGWQISLNGDDSASREARASCHNPGPGSLEQILAEERVQAVAQEIERLSPQARRCIYLRQQGRTYEEIAQILQVAIGTVKSHIYMARKQLKERLQDHFGDCDL